VLDAPGLDSNRGSRLEVRGPFDGDLVGAISGLCRERGWEVTELREAMFSLEDTFIELTRRSLGANHSRARGVA